MMETEAPIPEPTSEKKTEARTIDFSGEQLDSTASELKYIELDKNSQEKANILMAEDPVKSVIRTEKQKSEDQIESICRKETGRGTTEPAAFEKLKVEEGHSPSFETEEITNKTGESVQDNGGIELEIASDSVVSQEHSTGSFLQVDVALKGIHGASDASDAREDPIPIAKELEKEPSQLTTEVHNVELIEERDKPKEAEATTVIGIDESLASQATAGTNLEEIKMGSENIKNLTSFMTEERSLQEGAGNEINKGEIETEDPVGKPIDEKSETCLIKDTEGEDVGQISSLEADQQMPKAASPSKALENEVLEEEKITDQMFNTVSVKLAHEENQQKDGLMSEQLNRTAEPVSDEQSVEVISVNEDANETVSEKQMDIASSDKVPKGETAFGSVDVTESIIEEAWKESIIEEAWKDKRSTDKDLETDSTQIKIESQEGGYQEDSIQGKEIQTSTEVPDIQNNEIISENIKESSDSGHEHKVLQPNNATQNIEEEEIQQQEEAASVTLVTEKTNLQKAELEDETPEQAADIASEGSSKMKETSLHHKEVEVFEAEETSNLVSEIPPVAGSDSTNQENAAEEKPDESPILQALAEESLQKFQVNENEPKNMSKPTVEDKIAEEIKLVENAAAEIPQEECSHEIPATGTPLKEIQDDGTSGEKNEEQGLEMADTIKKIETEIPTEQDIPEKKLDTSSAAPVSEGKSLQTEDGQANSIPETSIAAEAISMGKIEDEKPVSEDQDLERTAEAFSSIETQEDDNSDAKLQFFLSNSEERELEPVHVSEKTEELPTMQALIQESLQKDRIQGSEHGKATESILEEKNSEEIVMTENAAADIINEEEHPQQTPAAETLSEEDIQDNEKFNKVEGHDLETTDASEKINTETPIEEDIQDKNIETLNAVLVTDETSPQKEHGDQHNIVHETVSKEYDFDASSTTLNTTDSDEMEYEKPVKPLDTVSEEQEVDRIAKASISSEIFRENSEKMLREPSELKSETHKLEPVYAGGETEPPIMQQALIQESLQKDEIRVNEPGNGTELVPEEENTAEIIMTENASVVILKGEEGLHEKLASKTLAEEDIQDNEKLDNFEGHAVETTDVREQMEIRVQAEEGSQGKNSDTSCVASAAEAILEKEHGEQAVIALETSCKECDLDTSPTTQEGSNSGEIEHEKQVDASDTLPKDQKVQRITETESGSCKNLPHSSVGQLQESSELRIAEWEPESAHASKAEYQIPKESGTQDKNLENTCLKREVHSEKLEEIATAASENTEKERLDVEERRNESLDTTLEAESTVNQICKVDESSQKEEDKKPYEAPELDAEEQEVEKDPEKEKPDEKNKSGDSTIPSLALIHNKAGENLAETAEQVLDEQDLKMTDLSNNNDFQKEETGYHSFVNVLSVAQSGEISSQKEEEAKSERHDVAAATQAGLEESLKKDGGDEKENEMLEKAFDSASEHKIDETLSETEPATIEKSEDSESCDMKIDSLPKMDVSDEEIEQEAPAVGFKVNTKQTIEERAATAGTSLQTEETEQKTMDKDFEYQEQLSEAINTGKISNELETSEPSSKKDIFEGENLVERCDIASKDFETHGKCADPENEQQKDDNPVKNLNRSSPEVLQGNEELEQEATQLQPSYDTTMTKISNAENLGTDNSSGKILTGETEDGENPKKIIGDLPVTTALAEETIKETGGDKQDETAQFMPEEQGETIGENDKIQSNNSKEDGTLEKMERTSASVPKDQGQETINGSQTTEIPPAETKDQISNAVEVSRSAGSVAFEGEKTTERETLESSLQIENVEDKTEFDSVDKFEDIVESENREEKMEKMGEIPDEVLKNIVTEHCQLEGPFDRASDGIQTASQSEEIGKKIAEDEGTSNAIDSISSREELIEENLKKIEQYKKQEEATNEKLETSTSIVSEELGMAGGRADTEKQLPENKDAGKELEESFQQDGKGVEELEQGAEEPEATITNGTPNEENSTAVVPVMETEAVPTVDEGNPDKNIDGSVTNVLAEETLQNEKDEKQDEISEFVPEEQKETFEATENVQFDKSKEDATSEKLKRDSEPVSEDLIHKTTTKAENTETPLAEVKEQICQKVEVCESIRSPTLKEEKTRDEETTGSSLQTENAETKKESDKPVNRVSARLETVVQNEEIEKQIVEGASKGVDSILSGDEQVEENSEGSERHDKLEEATPKPESGASCNNNDSTKISSPHDELSEALEVACMSEQQSKEKDGPMKDLDDLSATDEPEKGSTWEDEEGVIIERATPHFEVEENVKSDATFDEQNEEAEASDLAYKDREGETMASTEKTETATLRACEDLNEINNASPVKTAMAGEVLHLASERPVTTTRGGENEKQAIEEMGTCKSFDTISGKDELTEERECNKLEEATPELQVGKGLDTADPVEEVEKRTTEVVVVKNLETSSATEVVEGNFKEHDKHKLEEATPQSGAEDQNYESNDTIDDTKCSKHEEVQASNSICKELEFEMARSKDTVGPLTFKGSEDPSEILDDLPASTTLAENPFDVVSEGHQKGVEGNDIEKQTIEEKSTIKGTDNVSIRDEPAREVEEHKEATFKEVPKGIEEAGADKNIEKLKTEGDDAVKDLNSLSTNDDSIERSVQEGLKKHTKSEETTPFAEIEYQACKADDAIDIMQNEQYEEVKASDSVSKEVELETTASNEKIGTVTLKGDEEQNEIIDATAVHIASVEQPLDAKSEYTESTYRGEDTEEKIIMEESTVKSFDDNVFTGEESFQKSEYNKFKDETAEAESQSYKTNDTTEFTNSNDKEPIRPEITGESEDNRKQKTIEEGAVNELVHDATNTVNDGQTEKVCEGLDTAGAIEEVEKQTTEVAVVKELETSSATDVVKGNFQEDETHKLEEATPQSGPEDQHYESIDTIDDTKCSQLEKVEASNSMYKEQEFEMAHSKDTVQIVTFKGSGDPSEVLDSLPDSTTLVENPLDAVSEGHEIAVHGNELEKQMVEEKGTIEGIDYASIRDKPVQEVEECKEATSEEVPKRLEVAGADKDIGKLKIGDGNVKDLNSLSTKDDPIETGVQEELKQLKKSKEARPLAEIEDQASKANDAINTIQNEPYEEVKASNLASKEMELETAASSEKTGTITLKGDEEQNEIIDAAPVHIALLEKPLDTKSEEPESTYRGEDTEEKIIMEESTVKSINDNVSVEEESFQESEYNKFEEETAEAEGQSYKINDTTEITNLNDKVPMSPEIAGESEDNKKWKTIEKGAVKDLVPDATNTVDDGQTEEVCKRPDTAGAVEEVEKRATEVAVVKDLEISSATDVFEGNFQKDEKHKLDEATPQSGAEDQHYESKDTIDDAKCTQHEEIEASNSTCKEQEFEMAHSKDTVGTVTFKGSEDPSEVLESLAISTTLEENPLDVVSKGHEKAVRGNDLEKQMVQEKGTIKEIDNVSIRDEPVQEVEECEEVTTEEVSKGLEEAGVDKDIEKLRTEGEDAVKDLNSLSAKDDPIEKCLQEELKQHKKSEEARPLTEIEDQACKANDAIDAIRNEQYEEVNTSDLVSKEVELETTDSSEKIGTVTLKGDEEPNEIIDATTLHVASVENPMDTKSEEPESTYRDEDTEENIIMEESTVESIEDYVPVGEESCQENEYNKLKEEAAEAEGQSYETNDTTEITNSNDKVPIRLEIAGESEDNKKWKTIEEGAAEDLVHDVTNTVNDGQTEEVDRSNAAAKKQDSEITASSEKIEAIISENNQNPHKIINSSPIETPSAEESTQEEDGKHWEATGFVPEEQNIEDGITLDIPKEGVEVKKSESAFEIVTEKGVPMKTEISFDGDPNKTLGALPDLEASEQESIKKEAPQTKAEEHIEAANVAAKSSVSATLQEEKTINGADSEQHEKFCEMYSEDKSEKTGSRDGVMAKQGEVLHVEMHTDGTESEELQKPYQTSCEELETAVEGDNIESQTTDHEAAANDPVTTYVKAEAGEETIQEGKNETKEVGEIASKLDPVGHNWETEEPNEIKTTGVHIEEASMGLEACGLNENVEKQMEGKKAAKELDAVHVGVNVQSLETSDANNIMKDGIPNEKVRDFSSASMEQNLQIMDSSEKIETMNPKYEVDSKKTIDASTVTAAFTEVVTQEEAEGVPEDACGLVAKGETCETIIPNERNFKFATEVVSIQEGSVEVENLKNTCSIAASVDEISNLTDVTETTKASTLESDQQNNKGTVVEDIREVIIKQAVAEANPSKGEQHEGDKTCEAKEIETSKAKENQQINLDSSSILQPSVFGIFQNEGEKPEKASDLVSEENTQTTVGANEVGDIHISQPVEATEFLSTKQVNDEKRTPKDETPCPEKLHKTQEVMLQELGHEKIGVRETEETHTADKSEKALGVTDLVPEAPIHDKVAAIDSTEKQSAETNTSENREETVKLLNIPGEEIHDALAEGQKMKSTALTSDAILSRSIDVLSFPQASHEEKLQQEDGKKYAGVKEISRENEREAILPHSQDPIEETSQKSTEEDQKLGAASEVKEDLAGQEITESKAENATEDSIEELKEGKVRLSDLLEKSKRERQLAEGLILEDELQKKQVAVDQAEEEKTDEEEDGDEHKKDESSSDTPVIVEASRDVDMKPAHKKSHNILSGVGSKVKHSLAKVKKAITGKSTHPKSQAPKQGHSS